MNRRPEWCTHKDCIWVTCWQNCMCGGRLQKPESHEDDFNTHRFCLKNVLPNNEIFDLQVNKSDLCWFSLLFGKMQKDMDR